jgi:hypothetical protein
LLWPLPAAAQEFQHQFAPRGDFANVLAGQHFNTNGASCTSGEDTTSPWINATGIGGSPSCNYTNDTPPYQLMEDDEYAFLDSTGWQALLYDSIIPDVTGLLVVEWNLNVITEPGASAVHFRATDGGGNVHPYIWLRKAGPHYIRLYCSGDPTNIYDTCVDCFTLGEPLTLRLEWHEANVAEKGCTGIPSDCADCGCLYKNGVQIAECDGDDDGYLIDGFDFAAVNAFKIGLDAWHACDELPPEDTRCGDGLGLTFPEY